MTSRHKTESKSQSKIGSKRTRKKRPGAAASLDRNETENVQYFLKALNQISLVLHALGYMAEGEALAQVRSDLHHRIFWSPEKPVDILKVLH
jgi:hypothetical protein